MKKIIILSTLGIMLAGSVFAYDYYGKKCTGSKNCSACKNCKYCKHCAKDDGKCGVCK
ncbi:MAG: hypothetical protein PSX42_16460 [bacterium]|nr:hypothetical protein [bacterium]